MQIDLEQHGELVLIEQGTTRTVRFIGDDEKNSMTFVLSSGYTDQDKPITRQYSRVGRVRIILETDLP